MSRTDWNGSAKLAERFADLTGRVAIITGASRGIGRECALSLARLGLPWPGGWAETLNFPFWPAARNHSMSLTIPFDKT